MRYIINNGCSIPALSCNGLSNCMLVYGIFGDRTIDGCKNASLALTTRHRVTIRLHLYKGWVHSTTGLPCILQFQLELILPEVV